MVLLKSSKINFVTEDTKADIQASNHSLKPKHKNQPKNISPFISSYNTNLNNILQTTTDSSIFPYHDKVFQPIDTNVKLSSSHESIKEKNCKLPPKPNNLSQQLERLSKISKQVQNLPPKMSNLDKLLKNRASRRIPSKLKH